MSKRRKRKNRKPETIHCHCGAVARRVDRSVVYGESSMWGGGDLYVCSHYPECDSYVSADRITGKPLGTLAGKELRRLRIRTHELFDQLWKQGLMTRDDAYRWIGDRYGLPRGYVHIAMFSEYMCRSVIRDCERTLRNRIAC